MLLDMLHCPTGLTFINYKFTGKIIKNFKRATTKHFTSRMEPFSWDPPCVTELAIHTHKASLLLLLFVFF